ncbi:hypothetical protein N1851_000220 [Merluccius polli]|uniref:Uncharacterized protein n=1 Tax=Merluccius polli TaxID=89951 RepID=A0AA47NDX0_MERPO|nr:hypothetical protein N1851_000220 [Merluccius polli]
MILIQVIVLRGIRRCGSRLWDLEKCSPLTQQTACIFPGCGIHNTGSSPADDGCTVPLLAGQMTKTRKPDSYWKDICTKYAQGQFHFSTGKWPGAKKWKRALEKIDACPLQSHTKDLFGRSLRCSCGFHKNSTRERLRRDTPPVFAEPPPERKLIPQVKDLRLARENSNPADLSSGAGSSEAGEVETEAGRVRVGTETGRGDTETRRGDTETRRGDTEAGGVRKNTEAGRVRDTETRRGDTETRRGDTEAGRVRDKERRHGDKERRHRGRGSQKKHGGRESPRHGDKERRHGDKERRHGGRGSQKKHGGRESPRHGDKERRHGGRGSQKKHGGRESPRHGDKERRHKRK